MAEWHRTIKTAAMSGAAAGVLSAVAMGKLERNTAIAPRKGLHQLTWRGRTPRESRSAMRSTLPSIIIQQLISTSSGALRERIFGRNAGQQSIPQQLLGGATSAATAYVINHILTPRRSQPRIEKRSSPNGRFATYAAFAIGIALCGVMLTMKRDRH